MGTSLSVLRCSLYPAANGIAAYPQVLCTFILSKLLMAKVVLYRVFFKLLIKLFAYGKVPSVSVSIIRLSLKLDTFNLYYLYSNTMHYF